MRIIVNHLTRMQQGFICVAGVDVATGQHVRPVLMYGRLTVDLLERSGGPFDIASLVDLGPVLPQGQAPEVEDHLFQPERAHCVNVVPPGNLWALLRQVAHPKLVDIFGPDLRPYGRTCALDRGKGMRSLGCLVPAGRPRLTLDGFGELRLSFSDGIVAVSPRVTDIRLYGDDHVTPERDLVAKVDGRLAQGVATILSVGVGRPWPRPGDPVERHWLQVNGIHLEDDPVWRLG